MKKKINLQMMYIAVLAILATLVTLIGVFYTLFKKEVFDDNCAKIKENAQTALRAAVAVDAGMETYITESLNTYGINIKLH